MVFPAKWRMTESCCVAMQEQMIPATDVHPLPGLYRLDMHRCNSNTNIRLQEDFIVTVG